MVQRILIATLSQSKPMLVECVFSEGVLVMADPVAYPPSRDTLITEMLPRLIKRRASGFKVLVDEVSGEFSKMSGASQVRLNDAHTDGRPVISVALDRYQEMRRTKSIITPQTGTGFEIPQSLIDTSSNNKGETVYNINWPEVTASHVLTILSVYATLHNRPGTADYIAKLTAAFSMKTPATPSADWLIEHQNAKEKPPATLTGESRPDGSIVL